MRLQDTIKMMMRSFPRSYPSRIECLKHLFFTLGNGFRWVDGELVDSYYEQESGQSKDTRMVDEKTIFDQFNLDVSDEEIMKLGGLAMEDFISTKLENATHDVREEYIDIISANIINPKMSLLDIYSISLDYPPLSEVLNGSVKMKPDWKEGLVELCQWVIAKTTGYYDSDKEEDILDTRIRDNFIACKTVVTFLENS